MGQGTSAIAGEGRAYEERGGPVLAARDFGEQSPFGARQRDREGIVLRDEGEYTQGSIPLKYSL